MAAKIKSGDTVYVISGKDKKKIGLVESVFPKKSRAIVSGVNEVQKRVKASQKGPGYVDKRSASIHLSNIAYYDSKEKKPTRIGFKYIKEKDGSVSKVRYSKVSQEIIK